MAKQTIGIGTSANDGTGDALRVAFDKTNDNFNEIYADDFVTTARIADDAITEAHLDATNAPTDNYVLSYDSATSGFTWVPPTDGDITGIVAGGGLTGDASSGEATLVVVAGTGITVNADDVQIADDGVDHTQLAPRYTAVQDISTTSGTINLDASSYAAFNLTGNLTTATLNIQNMKTGQVIDILLSGTLSSAVITLADDFTTSAINKVGSNDLDTAGTNLIQVLCVDDTDSDAILTWAVATYTTDTSA